MNEVATTVILVDDTGWRWMVQADSDLALTLVAFASEDPSHWEDMIDCWDRYRSPVVPEFASSLPWATVDPQEALQALDQQPAWVMIDLRQKRVLTGGNAVEFERDDAFTMAVNDQGDHCWNVSIHLPPWWELVTNATSEMAAAPRAVPANVRHTNRELLYGSVFLKDLATRVLDYAASEHWPEIKAGRDEQDCYQFTVAVHRDWLMTPRADLNGGIPRDLLHGGMTWIDHLCWAQQLRIPDQGAMVALPTTHSSYETAPFGREELVMYFDLCRELIPAGWAWCRQHLQDQQPRVKDEHCLQLVNFLQSVKDQWMESPFEDGSPPRFIIECNRRRVIMASQIPIIGMSEMEMHSTTGSCECPICIMMAENEEFGGIGGFTIMGFDGHHLELDDDFAFSLYETPDDWEMNRIEYADDFELNDEDLTEEERAADDAAVDEALAAGQEDYDPFAPIWSGLHSDQPLPGDHSGHLALAFLVTEMVNVLGSLDAPRDRITELNKCFKKFRHQDPDARTARHRLCDYLEQLAEEFPSLVSRVADLQSRLQTSLRPEATDN